MHWAPSPDYLFRFSFFPCVGTVIQRLHLFKNIGRNGALVCLALAMLAAGCREPRHAQRDMHGLRTIDRAVRAGDHGKVEALIKEGAQVNGTDAGGVTPLHRAARNGDSQMVRLLLSYRADPTLRTKDGWNALHLAAWYGNNRAVKLLLANGATVNSRTPAGWNLLHMAAMQGMPSLVDIALRSWPGKKPDIDGQDKQGLTPLHRAINRAQWEVAGLLLRKGADANIRAPDGSLPLHMAVRAGNTGMVSRLLSHGARPGKRDRSGKTAMDLARDEEKTEIVRLFWQRDIQ